jgi:hypothetical protein
MIADAVLGRVRPAQGVGRREAQTQVKRRGEEGDG